MKVKSVCIKIVTILITCICIVLYHPQSISAYIIHLHERALKSYKVVWKDSTKESFGSGSFSLFFSDSLVRRGSGRTWLSGVDRGLCPALHRTLLAQGLHREILNNSHLVQAHAKSPPEGLPRASCLNSGPPLHHFLIFCTHLFCWESLSIDTYVLNVSHLGIKSLWGSFCPVLCPQHWVCSRGSINIIWGNKDVCFLLCHHHHPTLDSLRSLWVFKVVFPNQGWCHMSEVPATWEAKGSLQADPICQGISVFQYGDPPADGNQGIQNWTLPHPTSLIHEWRWR